MMSNIKLNALNAIEEFAGTCTDEQAAILEYRLMLILLKLIRRANKYIATQEENNAT